MSTYRKEWECCGDVSETQCYEPEECPFCRTSPAAPIAAVGGDLPPLPEPDHALDCGTLPFFNADQMRSYGAACVAAAAGAAKGGDGAPETAAVDLNRAQHGDPVDDYPMIEAVSDFRKAAYEFGKHHDADDHARMLEAQRSIFNIYRAAIKEAAPADAPRKSEMQWERDHMGNVRVKAVIVVEDIARLHDDPVARLILRKPEQTASDVCLLMESVFHRRAPVEDAREQQHTIK